MEEGMAGLEKLKDNMASGNTELFSDSEQLQPLYKVIVHLPGPPEEDEWACDKLRELGVDPDTDIHQGEQSYLEFHDMPGHVLDDIEFHLVFETSEYPVRIEADLMPLPREQTADYLAGYEAAMYQVEERLAGAIRQAEERSLHVCANQGVSPKVACSSTINTLQAAFAAATDTVGQLENIKNRLESAFRRLDADKEQSETKSQAPAPGC